MLPLCSDRTRTIASMAAFPCILYQHLHVRLDGHFCAVHAVADMLRRVWLSYPCPAHIVLALHSAQAAKAAEEAAEAEEAAADAAAAKARLPALP